MGFTIGEKLADTERTTARILADLVRDMLNATAIAIEDLSLEEVHYRIHDNANHIAFEAWHIARTSDNIVHFAFDREQPIWLRKGLHEAWHLPRVDQGTDMEPESAYSLRFPDPILLAGYIRDVAVAVESRVANMNDDYLRAQVTVRPHGQISRMRALGQVVIVHGSNHLGQINLARTFQGKSGIGF